MYALDYSINNMTLLALTLSVGFVVDDAIVMLENIVRHVEEGMTPFEAALKGSGEIGFTILSITVSLVAVFIPVLLMGGVVGRVFHEFAVTVTIAITASAFISLTLAPMLAARLPAERGRDGRQRRNLFERGFEFCQRHFELGGAVKRFSLRNQLNDWNILILRRRGFGFIPCGLLRPGLLLPTQKCNRQRQNHSAYKFHPQHPLFASFFGSLR